MTRLLLITSVLLVAGLGAADDELKQVPPPESTTEATVSEDDRPGRTTRKPFEDAILRELLRDADRPRLITPQDPDTPPTSTTAATVDEPADPSLMLEGTMIVERPATLVRSDAGTQITFKLKDGKRTVTMELLPNSLRELAEREILAGADELTISGEVTRYRGSNYMLLRKVVRRMDHGNLSP